MKVLLYLHPGSVESGESLPQLHQLQWLNDFERELVRQGCDAKKFDPLRDKVVAGTLVHVFSQEEPETWASLRALGARVIVSPIFRQPPAFSWSARFQTVAARAARAAIGTRSPSFSSADHYALPSQTWARWAVSHWGLDRESVSILDISSPGAAARNALKIYSNGERSIAFAIHHLRPWGGHDRSTLEVAIRISRKRPVELHAYTLEAPRETNWGSYRFFPVRPHFRKPAILMIAYFHIVTFLRFRRHRGKRRPLILATGTSSWISDFIQVQFVQAAWNERFQSLDSASYRSPSTRSGLAPLRWLRAGYNQQLLRYNLWAEQRLYTRDKKYIAISRSVADELRRHFDIPESRIGVIHHGVDPNDFRPSSSNLGDRDRTRQSLGIGNEDIVLLFVGEFERKGLSPTMKALARARTPRARLLVVGEGDRAGFETLATQLGISRQVIFAGKQKEVASFYRAADIFVLPTFYEPFGLVVIEAMASGLPIIVSKLAGAAELLSDNQSALLLEDPLDTESLAQAISRLVADSSLRKSLGDAARAEALKRGWDQVAEEYSQRICM